MVDIGRVNKEQSVIQVNQKARTDRVHILTWSNKGSLTSNIQTAQTLVKLTNSLTNILTLHNSQQ